VHLRNPQQSRCSFSNLGLQVCLVVRSVYPAFSFRAITAPSCESKLPAVGQSSSLLPCGVLPQSLVRNSVIRRWSSVVRRWFFVLGSPASVVICQRPKTNDQRRFLYTSEKLCPRYTRRTSGSPPSCSGVPWRKIRPSLIMYARSVTDNVSRTL